MLWHSKRSHIDRRSFLQNMKKVLFFVKLFGGGQKSILASGHFRDMSKVRSLEFCGDVNSCGTGVQAHKNDTEASWTVRELILACEKLIRNRIQRFEPPRNSRYMAVDTSRKCTLAKIDFWPPPKSLTKNICFFKISQKWCPIDMWSFRLPKHAQN